MLNLPWERILEEKALFKDPVRPKLRRTPLRSGLGYTARLLRDLFSLQLLA